jgi:hypothetical protein
MRGEETDFPRRRREVAVIDPSMTMHRDARCDLVSPQLALAKRRCAR